MKLKPILAITLLAVLPAGFSYAQSSPAAAKTSPAAAAKTSPAAAARTSPAAAAKTSPATTSPAAAATSPAAATTAAAARTDLYHVHFTHAAPGKATALADSLKQPDPAAPMPGHSVVLRHQDGDSWDYVGIEHLGPKATLEAARPVASVLGGHPRLERLAYRHVCEWSRLGRLCESPWHQRRSGEVGGLCRVDLPHGSRTSRTTRRDDQHSIGR